MRVASINDWARKAAERIVRSEPGMKAAGVERLAAIISIQFDPIEKLLRELKRTHRRYCPKSKDEDSVRPCTCGAATFNEKIDKVLLG